jgi:hypothetical protein
MNFIPDGNRLLRGVVESKELHLPVNEAIVEGGALLYLLENRQVVDGETNQQLMEINYTTNKGRRGCEGERERERERGRECEEDELHLPVNEVIM